MTARTAARRRRGYTAHDIAFREPHARPGRSRLCAYVLVAPQSVAASGILPGMPIYSDLAALLNDVAGRVDSWTRQEAWEPEPGSPGAAELANTEIRADGSPWGERPTRTVFQLGQMQMKMVVEYARSAALLVAAERTPPAIEVETRAALEAASVTWWLFEPGLAARERVCRLQLLRRNSARELARSIAEVGADPAAAGGETIPAIEAYGHSLGLASFGQGGDELEGQIRPRYTARVKDLTTELGYLGGYSIYSGVAHAELAGVWRLFGETATTVPDRQPIHSPVPNPEASHAATDGVLKALMAPAERTAFLFGWPSPGLADEYSATIDRINTEITHLKP